MPSESLSAPENGKNVVPVVMKTHFLAKKFLTKTYFKICSLSGYEEEQFGKIFMTHLFRNLPILISVASFQDCLSKVS